MLGEGEDIEFDFGTTGSDLAQVLGAVGVECAAQLREGRGEASLEARLVGIEVAGAAGLATEVSHPQLDAQGAGDRLGDHVLDLEDAGVMESRQDCARRRPGWTCH